MSILCCGIYNESEVRKLYNNENYEDRRLEIMVCPKCQKKKALITQRRIRDDKWITYYAPRNKVKNFIEKYLKEPWINPQKIKYGTSSNMNWLYIDGKIDNWVRDFNNIKRFEHSSGNKKQQME